MYSFSSILPYLQIVQGSDDSTLASLRQVGKRMISKKAHSLRLQKTGLHLASRATCLRFEARARDADRLLAVVQCCKSAKPAVCGSGQLVERYGAGRVPEDD